jgi:hypothetical protein
MNAPESTVHHKRAHRRRSPHPCRDTPAGASALGGDSPYVHVEVAVAVEEGMALAALRCSVVVGCLRNAANAQADRCNGGIDTNAEGACRASENIPNEAIEI